MTFEVECNECMGFAQGVNRAQADEWMAHHDHELPTKHGIYTAEPEPYVCDLWELDDDGWAHWASGEPERRTPDARTVKHLRRLHLSKENE